MATAAKKKRRAAPDQALTGMPAGVVIHSYEPDVAYDTLRPHPQNRRQGDIGVIYESMRRNGIYRPLYVQLGTRVIGAGHHTMEAAKLTGRTSGPVIWIDVDDDTLFRILQIDNRANDLADYDRAGLLDDLEAYAREHGGLEALQGTGYDLDALEDLRVVVGGLGEGDRGRVLALVAKLFVEPTAQLTHGDVFRHGAHVIICADVFTEHHVWIPLLVAAGAGAVFAPYPSPLAAATVLAGERAHVFVHPDPFVLGHLVDRLREVDPDAAFTRLA